MFLGSDHVSDGRPIAGEHSFCVPASEGHVSLGGNRNPQLTWGDCPAGTRSLVLICVDPEVPSKPDDVNQEGRTIPSDLPRVDFYHWVLVDLSPSTRTIGEGAYSDGVEARGKSGPAGPDGTRQGINDYTGWFAGDPDMSGEYFGYDGPCPPWNDSIIHHYHFTLYALDVDRCGVDGKFSREDVLAAIEGHVLGSASIVGTYTLNPSVG